jgi:hypothetical protein
MHHTKDKGDIACAMAISDLTKKGYTVFTATVSEHCVFDIIAYKDHTLHRIQCKYSQNGEIKSKTTWSDKNGVHQRKYQENDFDYYAIYLPDIDRVVYPSIKFAGKRIRTKPANILNGFWWWEDFIDFTDEAKTRNALDFNMKGQVGNLQPRVRKATRPEKEVLMKQINELGFCATGRIYNVSDNAIRKWVKSYPD